jgi:hypothetical protein
MKEEGKQCDSGGASRMSRKYGGIMKYGRRWKELIDIFNSPEIMLIHHDDDEVDLEEDWLIDISKIVLNADDSRFNIMKNRLQLPGLDLRETCWRLSGLVDAIQRLLPLPGSSELRKYLAHDIFCRIRGVFGPIQYFDDDSSEETDSSAEAEQSTHSANVEPVAGSPVGEATDVGDADAARYMVAAEDGTGDIMDMDVDFLSYILHSPDLGAK